MPAFLRRKHQVCFLLLPGRRPVRRPIVFASLPTVRLIIQAAEVTAERKNTPGGLAVRFAFWRIHIPALERIRLFPYFYAPPNGRRCQTAHN